MADINIDTNDVQYQRMMDALGVLRTALAPRVRLLVQLPRDKQRQWLQRDPLLRRAILFSRGMVEATDVELDE